MCQSEITSFNCIIHFEPSTTMASRKQVQVLVTLPKLCLLNASWEGNEISTTTNKLPHKLISSQLPLPHSSISTQEQFDKDGCAYIYNTASLHWAGFNCVGL
jgi:hypothetical protein